MICGTTTFFKSLPNEAIFGVSRIVCGVVLCWILAMDTHASEKTSEFREILELAGVDPEKLSQFGQDANFKNDDWPIITQILYRLRQFPDKQLELWSKKADLGRWLEEADVPIGELHEISGHVESCEVLSPPQQLAESNSLPVLYRCQFKSNSPGLSGTLFTRQIPQRWKPGQSMADPVLFYGVLLQHSISEKQCHVFMLADRVAWYPQQGVPTGQLLLARNGMDVALLDEIIQRQPFVLPTISRESEAFYSCLAALGRTNQEELISRCQENIIAVAEKWRHAFDDLQGQHQEAKKQLALASTPEDQQKWKKKETLLRERRSVAAAIIKQSKLGLSSLGPFFLNPEQEVGELVQLEGVARRAIRIVVPERPEIGAYYELEIFTSEAKYLENRPVVCCVNRLPEGFPQGDLIREPVRIYGMFFKSWLYRTRNIQEERGGETEGQLRLYTPLVLADSPVWIRSAAVHQRPWDLWAGIAFLVMLAAFWLNFVRVSHRKRRTEKVELK